MKYDNIQHIIELWAEFEEVQPNATPEIFGLWLLQRSIPPMGDVASYISTENALKKEKKTIKPSAVPNAKSDYDEPAVGIAAKVQERQSIFYENEIDQQIGILINRLGRYTRFYTKKAFESVADISLDEFGFLLVTYQLGRPKKSEVISMNLFEPTTGTEILRRLIHDGFLQQFDNPDDKRSKVLVITPKGKDILTAAIVQMKRVCVGMVSGLDYTQKQHLASILSYLNDLHGKIYFKRRDEDITNLFDFLGA